MRVLPLLLTIGCYGSAAPSPTYPTPPPLEDGATAEIEVVRGKPFIASDGRYIDDQASLYFKYGGDAKTYSEYRAIVDPAWRAKLDKHAALVTRCRRANIPKYIAYGLIAGGLAWGLWSSNIVGDDEAAQAAGFYGGIGAGTLAYFSGWAFFGGRACNAATRMYDGANPWLEYADKTSMPDFDDTKAELRALTEQFNARVRGQPSRAAVPDQP